MGEVVTYSAKMNSETRDELKALIEESQLDAREFMARMVGIYKAGQTQTNLGHVKEIEALHHHVARIEEIYVNLVKDAADQKEADGIALRQATEEIARIKAAALDAQNEATARVEAAQTEATQVRQQAETDIQAMRGNVETAHKDVADIREALAQARDAQQQSARLAVLAEEAASAAKARSAELEALAARAEEYRQVAELARVEAAQAYAKAEKDIAEIRDSMAKAAERAEIEREKAVLFAQRESMNEIGKLREALAQTREELAQAKAALEIASHQKSEPKPGQPRTKGRNQP